MFWADIWKIWEFLSENFQFLVMKSSKYLNRRVFIMIGHAMRKRISVFITYESNGYTHKTVIAFGARLASFGQLCLITDPYIIFKKSRNELNGYKWLNNINYTIVNSVEATFVWRGSLIIDVQIVNSCLYGYKHYHKKLINAAYLI